MLRLHDTPPRPRRATADCMNAPLIAPGRGAVRPPSPTTDTEGSTRDGNPSEVVERSMLPLHAGFNTHDLARAINGQQHAVLSPFAPDIFPLGSLLRPLIRRERIRVRERWWPRRRPLTLALSRWERERGTRTRFVSEKNLPFRAPLLLFSWCRKTAVASFQGQGPCQLHE
jgi:hypothetical protein